MVRYDDTETKDNKSSNMRHEEEGKDIENEEIPRIQEQESKIESNEKTSEMLEPEFQRTTTQLIEIASDDSDLEYI